MHASTEDAGCRGRAARDSSTPNGQQFDARERCSALLALTAPGETRSRARFLRSVAAPLRRADLHPSETLPRFLRSAKGGSDRSGVGLPRGYFAIRGIGLGLLWIGRGLLWIGRGLPWIGFAGYGLSFAMIARVEYRRTPLFAGERASE